MRAPLPTGANGNHDCRGRFQRGNKAAKGNPHAQRVGRLRSALLEAVDEAAIRRVVEALVKEAEGGNVPAVKELLDRCLGKSQEADLIERIEALEQALLEQHEVCR